MNSKKNPASDWKLYCILDSALLKKRGAVKLARLLFKSGVKAVQLRCKNCPSYEIVRIAKKLKRSRKGRGKILIINDRIDAVHAAGAGGVHLGSGDMNLRAARYLLGSRGVIGKTVHSVAEARKTKTQNLDYIGAGPVFFTPLKKKLKKRGPAFIRKIKKYARVPVFAIGGINKQNVKMVFKNGADGVCVSRGALQAAGLLKKIKLLKGWGK